MQHHHLVHAVRAVGHCFQINAHLTHSALFLDSAHQVMSGSTWKKHAEQLSELIQDYKRNEIAILELLKSLNASIYPIDYLKAEEVESLVTSLLKLNSGYNGEFIIQLAHLTYSLITYQKAIFQPDVLTRLLYLFLSSLTATHPPNELLYAAASILQLGVSHENPQSLLDIDGTLFKMALTTSYTIETQRAGLHFLTTLCEKSEFPRDVLIIVLDNLLQSMSSVRADDRKPLDTLLINKLLLSKLYLLHSLLPHLSPLPSLPILLSLLKANMAVGLPGQQNKTLSGSIQPPLTVPQLLPRSSPKSRVMRSVAGPQERQSQGKGRHHSKKKSKAAKTGSSDDSSQQSSDSESSSSTSESSLPQWSRGICHERAVTKRKNWGRGRRGVSSSESDVSDSDSGSTELKAVQSKIRYQSLSSLQLIFQLLDHHTSFSYWLSFLPDGPRPPNSPPLLLTCILKDPIPKCRGAAVSVLSAMLEGSKVYLAAANDKPHPSQSFTPYSITLGCVIRELHRSLLLALAAESHPTTLTQIIKAIGFLVANTPYHQLSEGYITRVVGALGKVYNHKDLNIQVACLTCYGAVVSLSPSHSEVERWLSNPDKPTNTPWLLQHCISLLQYQSSLTVQTESLQVLSALAKFYFLQIRSYWLQLKDFYLSHLTLLPNRVQQHVLKMLEELCRALSSSPSAELTIFWEQLLGGPLTALLQNYHEQEMLSAKACDILSTMPPQTMSEIKGSIRILALTLPLGLSKDESAPSAVSASAIRVLGVFVLFETLREDDSFFLDCQSAITHCLNSASVAVRVQASWALANLTDSFSHHHNSLHPSLLLSLSKAVLCSLQDGDKIKCNGVRAAGNLLKQLPEQVSATCKTIIEQISHQVVKCVNSGSMKSRWNACYACCIAFTNSVFTSGFPAVVSELLSSLCVAVQKCKNFKVRSNAASALSSAAMNGAISCEQLSEVWIAVLQALENSEHQMDFSEFKHAAVLKKQLCKAICHLLVKLPLNGVTSFPSQELQDSFHKHIAHFLTQASMLNLDGESDSEIDETQTLIEMARLSLEQMVKQDSLSVGSLKELLKIFRVNSEGTETMNYV